MERKYHERRSGSATPRPPPFSGCRTRCRPNQTLLKPSVDHYGAISCKVRFSKPVTGRSPVGLPNPTTLVFKCIWTEKNSLGFSSQWRSAPVVGEPNSRQGCSNQGRQGVAEPDLTRRVNELISETIERFNLCKRGSICWSSLAESCNSCRCWDTSLCGTARGHPVGFIM